MNNLSIINDINTVNQNAIEIGDILGIIIIIMIGIFIIHGISLVLSIISTTLNNKDKINVFNLIINIICPIINLIIFQFVIPLVCILLSLCVFVFSVVNFIRNIKNKKLKKE